MQSFQSVLVIEDLPEVAEWLNAQSIAVLPQAQVTVVNAIAPAREALAQKVYDLALVDLGLPDGSGACLIPEIKKSNANALCVVTTIFDDAQHLLESLKAGADGYLLKDDPEPAFRTQLEGILHGRPPLSASIAKALLQQFQPQPNNEQVGLTTRETEMLTLTAKGYQVKQAAELLGISYHTAASYLKEVYRKLQINSRAEATLKAMNMGLVNPE
ncbi:response regulator [Aliidiomarina celeris]|uniref:response regulator n=1 Tax=Aliidiomarina celeris TaxID=2249428 RepID=UPI000DE867B8|nr:response regulator transcription factor [Aliidiomarina celeris]